MVRRFLAGIPAALILFRAVAACAVVPLGWFHIGRWLAAVILLATLSDVFDGIIARRLNVATVALRRADSMVDLAFWIMSLVALYFLRPAAIRTNVAVVAFAIGAEIVLQALSLARFGRMTATHARSAKFMGLCLLVGMMMIALGGSSAIAFWIIGVGTAVAALDGYAIILILPRWEADIPSVFDAWRIRQGEPIRRHWLG
jgi:CDP-diacylglycerol--glycerol-3-phosphate 3-phosphatidyltransferase